MFEKEEIEKFLGRIFDYTKNAKDSSIQFMVNMKNLGYSYEWANFLLTKDGELIFLPEIPSEEIECSTKVKNTQTLYHLISNFADWSDE